VKGFFFRLFAVIFILTAVLANIYTDALACRDDAFDASHGDVVFDSMIFSEFTACCSADGKPQLVVGGTVYPENNRNYGKNVFFKLYNADGDLIATSGLNETNCSLLLNTIEKTDYGFAIVCEVRGENENYGKVYEYSHDGSFIKSISIRYSEKLPQTAGTEYGICISDTTTYFTAIDSEKTVCTDAEGKYLLNVANPPNSTVCDAVVTDEIIYTAGSFDDKNGVPKAYINAFSMENSAFLWSRKELVTKNDSSEGIYSQTEEITILTENGLPASLLIYGKYFDSAIYKNYLIKNNIEFEEDIDTAAKKCLRRDFPLYRTGYTLKDYVKAPYPSVFLMSAEIFGDMKKMTLYEADYKKSYSSVSLSTSSVGEKEDFSVCMASVDTVKLDTEKFNTVIKGIDGDLKELYSAEVAEPTVYKTFFTALSGDSFFNYTTINTSDEFSARMFTPLQYKSHLLNIEKATEDILFIRKVMDLLPICIMFSMLYIMTRIRSLSRGVGYIPKDLFRLKNGL